MTTPEGCGLLHPGYGLASPRARTRFLYGVHTSFGSAPAARQSTATEKQGLDVSLSPANRARRPCHDFLRCTGAREILIESKYIHAVNSRPGRRYRYRESVRGVLPDLAKPLNVWLLVIEVLVPPVLTQG